MGGWEAESGRYQMRRGERSLVRLEVQIILCTCCLEEEGVKALSRLDGKGRGEGGGDKERLVWERGLWVLAVSLKR